MNTGTILLLIICIIMACIFTSIYEKSIRDDEKEKSSKKIDFAKYKRKNLLTKTEYSFYMKSRDILKEKNLFMYPKVRLEDFVEVEGDGKEKQSLRGRIKSRHIDFLISDEKLRIKAAIELDDKSHVSQKAQTADQFKDSLFQTINIPLFRIQVKADYADDIKNILEKL